LLGDTVTAAGGARPIWTVLETEAPHPKRLDAGHWVSVYTNLLALLSGGARVSIGERTTGDLVTVDPDQVSERLLYWQAKVELAG
jgi:hypothetical protein